MNEMVPHVYNISRRKIKATVQEKIAKKMEINIIYYLAQQEYLHHQNIENTI